MACVAAILFAPVTGCSESTSRLHATNPFCSPTFHHELQRRSSQDMCQQERQISREISVCLGASSERYRFCQRLCTIHRCEYRRCNNSDMCLEDKHEGIPLLRVSIAGSRSLQQSAIHQSVSRFSFPILQGRATMITQ